MKLTKIMLMKQWERRLSSKIMQLLRDNYKLVSETLFVIQQKSAENVSQTEKFLTSTQVVDIFYNNRKQIVMMKLIVEN